MSDKPYPVYSFQFVSLCSSSIEGSDFPTNFGYIRLNKIIPSVKHLLDKCSKGGILSNVDGFDTHFRKTKKTI